MIHLSLFLCLESSQPALIIPSAGGSVKHEAVLTVHDDGFLVFLPLYLIYFFLWWCFSDTPPPALAITGFIWIGVSVLLDFGQPTVTHGDGCKGTGATNFGRKGAPKNFTAEDN